MKITVLIPTLNEIDGLKATLPRIRKEWYDQLLVVDGNSMDGTAEYARQQGCEVLMQKSKGLRRAYNEAYPQIRGDITITLSPDGNCIPEAIPQLVEKMKAGYDMVIASRYAKGAKSEDDDILTGFGNWLFTTLINFLYRSRYTDTLGIFRAWKTRLLKELDIDREEGYAMEKLVHSIAGSEIMFSIRAAKKKLRVGEIPVDEPARMGGKRKVLIFRWGLIFLLQTLRELYFWPVNGKEKMT